MVKKGAVIGKPISHSRSPAIFSFLADQLGMRDFQYSAIEVSPSGLSEFLGKLRADPSRIGLNVTIPHKEAILSFVDELSPEARTVGAANVIHHHEGRLTGYNTDVVGVSKTLEERGCDLQGKSVWIWGAGGAARAVAYAVGKAGAKDVYFYNRTPERSRKIVADLTGEFPMTRYISLAGGLDSIRDARIDGLSLVVNSTSVGMKGVAMDPKLFEFLGELSLNRDVIAFDLIYDPERTPFLSLAEKRGARTAGGLDMLIYQALATWEIWFGPLKADEARGIKESLSVHLKELLRQPGESRGPERPIFLTGFMGSGKSVVGAVLARRLGWRYIDTDQLIVEQAGMPISRIFAEKGEAFFRELERQAVLNAASSGPAVVSLGGGAVMNPEVFREVEAAGILVFLSAQVETLVKRLRHSAGSRPLLAGLPRDEQQKRIQSLLKERLPVYERAKLRIETDCLDAEAVATEIERHWRRETQ